MLYSNIVFFYGIKAKEKIYLNYEAKQKSKLLEFKYHLGPHGIKTNGK